MDNNILVHFFKVGKRFKKIKKYKTQGSPLQFLHKNLQKLPVLHILI
jgi:hypothetical protein